MSGKARSRAAKTTSKPRRGPDLRVRRTRERLGAALITLIQEKTLDKVTVQEVLDRAGVGRSTFYLHFRDTDDLLLTQFETLLEMMSTALSRSKDQSNRIMPVAEMFDHIGNQKKVYRALAESGRLQDFYELAQGHFERGIEQRLREIKRASGLSTAELPVLSSALAGSLLSLLRRWIDRGARESPKTMDDLFHRMAWKGLQ